MHLVNFLASGWDDDGVFAVMLSNFLTAKDVLNLACCSTATNTLFDVPAVWTKYLVRSEYICHNILRNVGETYATQSHPLNHRLLIQTFLLRSYAEVAGKLRSKLCRGELSQPLTVQFKSKVRRRLRLMQGNASDPWSALAAVVKSQVKVNIHKRQREATSLKAENFSNKVIKRPKVGDEHEPTASSHDCGSSGVSARRQDLALHRAVLKQSPLDVRFWLRKGGNPNAEVGGKSFVELARESPNKEVYHLLMVRGRQI